MSDDGNITNLDKVRKSKEESKAEDARFKEENKKEKEENKRLRLLAKAEADAAKAPPMGVLHSAVIEAFNRESAYLPKPRVRLAVYLPPKGAKQIIELKKDGLCEIKELDFVVDEISFYCSTLKYILHNEWYEWEYKHVVACAKLWVARTQATEEPKPYLFKSNPGRCFSRLHFDLVDYKNLDLAPRHHELVGRLTNREAVLTWIGSIFHTGSYREKYLWIVGGGRDGKGSLLAGVLRVLGEASYALQDMPSDNHWALSFEHKCLVAFTDFEDVKVLNSSRFKALTGNDLISVRPLFRAPYRTQMHCLIWINSNKMPQLTTKAASLERILFAEMTPPPQGTVRSARYKDQLWDEIAVFLGYCSYLYKKNIKHGEPVQSDQATKDDMQAWASVHEQEFEVIVSKHLVLSPENLMKPAAFQGLLGELMPRRNEQLQFVEWLRNTHGIRKTTVRLGSSHPEKVWKGASLKPKDTTSLPPQGCIEPFKCLGSLKCKGTRDCKNFKK